ncbi:3-isopropylmalate dehydratase small subunit [Xanthobacter aminoxidans]|uniref:3-isopropylmalate dehydratase small subunit n=1 Tax=Xanthobacter aminoxidans TaxID=186280 RepID=UPI002022E2C4|nr:3-isopropylmalate dehydratase small subunit [Xanthobacter aminoxidans]MCL8385610.1 3-isopropylmalate dehydratase small subunit [Xanthobacter aminoxidans]
MLPFVTVEGAAAPFLLPNVDTDVIMPKTFLKGIDRAGLDRGVFNLLRFRADGAPEPEFILNRPGYEGARFLVVGPNFGCGSSREHAVWGLAQLGIRALIGTSFAGIFDDNCRNNGLLTISLDPAVVARIAVVVARPETSRLRIDLPAERVTIVATGEEILFEIEPLRKEPLLRGLDAVGTTLAEADSIRAFEARHRAENPWLA